MNRTTKNNSPQITPVTATVFQICKPSVITCHYANFSSRGLLLMPASEVVLNGISRKSERLLALFPLLRISFPVWRSSFFLFLYLPISLYLYLYVYISISLSTSLYICIYINIYFLSISLYISISTSVFLFKSMSLYISIYLNIYITPLSPFIPF